MTKNRLCKHGPSFLDHAAMRRGVRGRLAPFFFPYMKELEAVAPFQGYKKRHGPILTYKPMPFLVPNTLEVFRGLVILLCLLTQPKNIVREWEDLGRGECIFCVASLIFK